MRIGPRDALLIIDVQKDFCPGGALAVPGGDEIAEGLGDLAAAFGTVVLSQDWHPPAHASFASQHVGRTPGEQVDLAYGAQTLWPDHCVQGTAGAAFTDALLASGAVDLASAIVRKGMNPQIDSYSAFFENDQRTSTGLAGWLRDRGIDRVFVAGLAYDFCVGFTALDARSQGFEAVVIKDLSRGIGLPALGGGTTIDQMERRFTEAEVVVVDSPALVSANRPAASPPSNPAPPTSFRPR